jgi:hypothetical protein
MRYRRFLPADVAALAAAAPGLPEGTSGWTGESARHAFRTLQSSRVAVVDIEVYDRVVWGFAPAGESWTCHRFAGELAADFALRSRREARVWVDNFPRQEVLFIIEFSAQDAAAEATSTVVFDDDTAWGPRQCEGDSFGLRSSVKQSGWSFCPFWFHCFSSFSRL